MHDRLGVRGRLLMAFFGISAFAVLAAAAAMYSFLEVGKALDRITQQRVPTALSSLEISRQAELIVAVAPALLTISTPTQREQLSAKIAAEIERLDALLSDLQGSSSDAAVLVGVHRNTAASFYTRLRKVIAEEMEKASPFAGEIEVDESYFGGRRKGKRGRGAGGKVPVFGLLKRGGKVYTAMIPNCID